MSATCIVCLGDLDAAKDLPPVLQIHSKASSPAADDDDDEDTDKVSLASDRPFSDLHMIAHLRPCGHGLHDECLKPWVERANSCPICRQKFNSVDLSAKVGGMLVHTWSCLVAFTDPCRVVDAGVIVSSYAVEDRVQVADVDPTLIADDVFEDDFDSTPCPYCGKDDNEDVLLLCDGCDVCFHTYCIGLEDVPPGHWFCEGCEEHRALNPYESSREPSRTGHHTSDRRTRAQQRRLRRYSQVNDQPWARVWQSVWDNLNLDLDVPFDDNQSLARYRQSQQTRENERREFQAWQRRYEVAQRMGGQGQMFRNTRNTLLNPRTPRQRTASPPGETAEERQAWKAMERAKELEADGGGKRKRKSITSSPVEAQPAPQPERKLKRPKTRRTLDVMTKPSDNAAAESSASGSRIPTTAMAAGGPSFLQSLLREVEAAGRVDAPHQPQPARLSTSKLNTDHASPRPMTSSGSSPTTSNHSSPRALSNTPPPSATRPGSPFQLTSRVEPDFSPPDFSPDHSPIFSPEFSSPFSPTRPLPTRPNANQGHPAKTRPKNLDRQSRPIKRSSLPSSRAGSSDASPTRATMSFSAKAEIQQMVKAALKPFWHRGEVAKENYTYVNRVVSRLLYDKVGDVAALDQIAKEDWGKVAADEVEQAIQALKSA